ncbi:hypothetical protein EDB86DRAFT_3079634 [Lactarius hatsudake]|nr:hypothetical protein EDB86DRAFT_3079634 [Lactarius hatsudake]
MRYDNFDCTILYLATLVTTLTLCTYSPAHGPSFVLALALALRSIRALPALTPLAFDTELLAVALGTPIHQSLLADTFPYAFFDDFSPRLHRTTSHQPPHLALPCSTTALASRARSLLAVRLPRNAAQCEHAARTRRGFCAGAGGHWRAGKYRRGGSRHSSCLSRVLQDKVSLKTQYKQVGSPLLNAQALCMLRHRDMAIEAAKGGRRPVSLPLWTRPPLGSALRYVVFPSGAHWELEREKWVPVN